MEYRPLDTLCMYLSVYVYTLSTVHFPFILLIHREIAAEHLRFAARRANDGEAVVGNELNLVRSGMDVKGCAGSYEAKW